MISRRQANWLITSGALFGACRDSLLGAEFWDKKDPSDWSAEELEKMLTKSPWAKQVTLGAEGRGGGAPGGMGGGMPGGMGGGMPGGGGGGMPGGGGSGMPGGMGGGMPGGAPGGGGPGAGPKPRIRWESALPILLASKKQVSAAERESYVISVADLPFGGGRGPGRAGGAEKGKAQPLEVLAAYLHPKDKQSFRAENSETGTGVIRFYFPRANHLFTKEDKEITFEAQLGPTALKAKFSLKDMIYRGKLEL